MKSLLTITTAASNLSLLTLAEMRAAAGVTDNGSDTALQAMERRVAASIMSECNIAIGGGSPPTLLRETLTQTIYQACGENLILARRHDIVITSIVEDDVTLLAADYMVDPESGLATKLCNDYPSWWSARKIVVVYAAGFATVPQDLKQEAIDRLRSVYLEQGRDPLVKSEETEIPGLMREKKDFWVGAAPGQSSSGGFPDTGNLTRYRIPAVG